jgi:hypothetical protein
VAYLWVVMQIREQILPEDGSKSVRIMGSFAAMVFGIAILLLSLLAISNPTAVMPQEMIASNAAEMKQVEEVKYYLPYPGILPDSPFYKVKMFRDKIQLLLMTDPLKKSQQELLFADKRINAAMVLLDGGKASLGVTTATKAEKYLEQSANGVIFVQKEGKDVKSWLLTLKTASAKHSQILLGMRDKLSGNDRLIVERTIKNTQMVSEKVEQALLDSK